MLHGKKSGKKMLAIVLCVAMALVSGLFMFTIAQNSKIVHTTYENLNKSIMDHEYVKATLLVNNTPEMWFEQSLLSFDRSELIGIVFDVTIRSHRIPEALEIAGPITGYYLDQNRKKVAWKLISDQEMEEQEQNLAIKKAVAKLQISMLELESVRLGIPLIEIKIKALKERAEKNKGKN